RDFPNKPDNDLFVQCRLNLKLPPSVADLIPPSTLISTVPVTHESSPHWRTTLAYFLSANLLRRLRSQRATVRLDVCSLDSQGRHETVGSVSLELCEARVVVMRDGKRELREVVKFVVDKGNWSPLVVPGASKDNKNAGGEASNGRTSRASNVSTSTTTTGGVTPTTGRRRPEIKAGVFVVDMPRIGGEVQYNGDSIAASTPPQTPLSARFDRGGLGVRAVGGLNAVPRDLGLALSPGNVGDLFTVTSEGGPSSNDGEGVREEEDEEAEEEKEKAKERDKEKERERRRRVKEKERDKGLRIEVPSPPPLRTSPSLTKQPAPPLLHPSKTDDRLLSTPTTTEFSALPRTQSRSPPASASFPILASIPVPRMQSRSPPASASASFPILAPIPVPLTQSRSPPASASASASASLPIFAPVPVPCTRTPTLHPPAYHQIGPGTSRFTFYFSVTHADHLGGLVSRASPAHYNLHHRPPQLVYHFAYHFLGTRVSTSQARSLSRASFGPGARHLLARDPDEQKTCFHIRGDLDDVRGWLDDQSKLFVYLVARTAVTDPSTPRDPTTPTIPAADDDETVIGMAEIPLRGLYYADTRDNESSNAGNTSFEKVVTERGFPVYNIHRELSVSPRKEIARVGVRVGLVSGWWTEEEVVEAGLSAGIGNGNGNGRESVRRGIRFDDVSPTSPGANASGKERDEDGMRSARRMIVGPEGVSPKFPAEGRGNAAGEATVERGTSGANGGSDTGKYGHPAPKQRMDENNYDKKLPTFRSSPYIQPPPPSARKDRSSKSPVPDHQQQNQTPIVAPAPIPATLRRNPSFTHARSSSVPMPLKVTVAQPSPGPATATGDIFPRNNNPSDRTRISRPDASLPTKFDSPLTASPSLGSARKQANRASSPLPSSHTPASAPASIAAAAAAAGLTPRTRSDEDGYRIETDSRRNERHRSNPIPNPNTGATPTRSRDNSRADIDAADRTETDSRRNERHRSNPIPNPNSGATLAWSHDNSRADIDAADRIETDSRRNERHRSNPIPNPNSGATPARSRDNSRADIDAADIDAEIAREDEEPLDTETLALMYLEALDLVRDHARRWDRVREFVTREVDKVAGEREKLKEWRNVVEGSASGGEGSEPAKREVKETRESLSESTKGLRIRDARESLSESAKGLRIREGDLRSGGVAAGGWA
ncbi:hypothetical protein BC938DRAFT_472836, partial [Jimgerdemannia flammicorona]